MEHSECYTWDEEKRTFKERFADGMRSTAEFIRDNKEAIVVLAPIVVAGASGAAKAVKWIARTYTTTHELKVTSHRCYDTSAGHYWNLKRALTNSDWLLVSERMAKGEKLGYILDDMRVLKK